MRGKKTILFLLLAAGIPGQIAAFRGTIRFSDRFYAAQRFFYAQALKLNPKITADKSMPEAPLRGTATIEEIRKIEPLTEYYDAREAVVAEAAMYPEQVLPELYAFLNGHPALSASQSAKPKFEAVEKYFYPLF